MTVKELSIKTGLEAAVLPFPDKEIKGVYVGDLLSWVMGKCKEGDAWITIMSNVNVLAVASLTDTSCVILSENVTLDSALCEMAAEKGVNILYSKKSSYETSLIINGALK